MYFLTYYFIEGYQEKLTLAIYSRQLLRYLSIFLTYLLTIFSKDVKLC